MSHRLSLVLMIAPAMLSAQSTPRTIAPNMSRAQVVAALGQPATTRIVGERAYLFYVNSCGRRCGMNDLVVLQRDSVVDAIFRAPQRRYSGTSSSPASLSPAVARRMRPAAKKADSAAAPATRPMRPGPPSDTRPSIPVSPPLVRPAPSSPAVRTP